MANSTSSVSRANKSANKGAAKQQSENKSTNSTRRVVETRDQWQVIFDYTVELIVAYSRNQKPSDPRSGFGFGPTGEQPHSRAYAKSLIWGFATNKAGKVLKDLDDLAVKANREKLAIAILKDCKFVKGDDLGLQLNKIEPKRERMVAESVLKELTKPTEPTTPKGGKPKKTTAPKGSKPEAKSQPKKAEKPAKPAAPKSSKPKSQPKKAEKPQTEVKAK